MSNELQVYEDERFGRVRAVMGNDGEPWFVAADVARVLEMADATHAVRGLEEDEKGIHKVETLEETYEPADGLDQYEHGTKLSAGLQEIVSAYTRIQDTNSLRDEDICLFEVVLREGKKFSNKALRDFLEQEGMTIVSVRDSRHAIVSSSKAEFGSLQRRVGNYRDNKKSNKKFQYIDDFKFPNPLDKLAPSIRDMLGK